MEAPEVEGLEEPVVPSLVSVTRQFKVKDTVERMNLRLPKFQKVKTTLRNAATAVTQTVQEQLRKREALKLLSSRHVADAEQGCLQASDIGFRFVGGEAKALEDKKAALKPVGEAMLSQHQEAETCAALQVPAWAGDVLYGPRLSEKHCHLH